DVLELPGLEDGDVVHEDVDLRRGSCKLIAARFGTHVRGHAAYRRSRRQLPNRADRIVHPRLGPPVHRDGRTLTGQERGNGVPYSGGRSGDEGAFSSEL